MKSERKSTPPQTEHQVHRKGKEAGAKINEKMRRSLDRFAAGFKRDTHLHSREHVLADNLSQMMLEPKRFAAYLGIAKLYEESDLRALAKRVLEKADLEPKNRGKYFFGALKGLRKQKASKSRSLNSKQI